MQLKSPTQLKDGSTPLDPRTDRVDYRPESNRPWNVETLFGEHAHLVEQELQRRSRGHTPGPGLNQGQEGQCCLYGATHRRNSTPKKLRPPMTNQLQLRDWYHDVQHADPWDGCDWGRQCPRRPGPDYGGTSVHSTMVYGRDQGWWSSFWWVGAGSGDVLGDIVKANQRVGGIVYGLPWLQSMFQPRPSGLLEVDRGSRTAGGHCVYGPAVRLKMRLRGEWTGTKEVVVFQQSWGEDYGVADLGRPGGMVYMLLDDLGWLMTQHPQRGEGVVVIR